MMVIGIMSYASLLLAASTEQTESPAQSSSILLNNYAFAHCMARSFNTIGSIFIRFDANKASKRYAASEPLNEKEVRAINRFLGQWLNKSYLGKSNADLKIMRCIDFMRSANRAVVPDNFPIRSYDASEQLYNFILASCVGQVFYSNKKVRADAQAAKSGYIEFGENPVGDYSRIDSLIWSWLEYPPSRSFNDQPSIMKCLGIYHTREFHDLVSLYTGEVPSHFRSFVMDYCLSIENTELIKRDNVKRHNTAVPSYASADAYKHLSDFTEQWLKEPHSAIDEGCEGLYSSPSLLEVIKPYSDLAKQSVD